MIKDIIIAFLVLCCIGLTAAWLIAYVKDEQQDDFKE